MKKRFLYECLNKRIRSDRRREKDDEKEDF